VLPWVTRKNDFQPRRGWDVFGQCPQGSRSAPTLGWM